MLAAADLRLVSCHYTTSRKLISFISKVDPLHARRRFGGRGSIAPLFLNLGCRRGWSVVSITLRPRFTPAERIPDIHVQGAGWNPEPAGRGGFFFTVFKMRFYIIGFQNCK
jgi:hypothetical protein